MYKKHFVSFFLILFMAGICGYAEEINLIDKASSAIWSNSALVSIPFGSDRQNAGTVKYMNNVKMEDGLTYERVLFTHPQWIKQGTMVGVFNNISIPEGGGKLIIAGGLLQDTSGTDGVTFLAYFSPAGAQPRIISGKVTARTLGNHVCSFTAIKNQRVNRVEGDLSRYAGQTGILILMVDAGENSNSDSAAWTEAKLVFGAAQESKPEEDQILFLKTLAGHQNRVYGVNFSPNNKYLVSAGGDNSAKVWEVETGNMILDLGGHASHVFQANFSPDSRYVATAGANYARIWEIPSGTELRSVGDHPERVNAVNFNPGGDRLLTASSDGTVKVWDWRNRNELLSIDITDGDVYYACFSPNGRFIAAGSTNGLVGLWDANSGQLVRRFLGHSRAIPFLSFNNDGSRLLTSSVDDTARIWDVGNGNSLLTLGGHTFKAAVFSPNGKFIISGNEDGKVIVWNAADGKEITTLYHTGGQVNSVAFSADGKHFASGGENREAKIWKFNLK
ncbi:MAG: WD40 repeat domain-containing protein [Candidatus Aminicenantes bacterium]|nr:WD40 repeat domain-containing protein [Candidatus Aminicenantes bacterium]